MAQAAPLVIADGATTPVNVTFAVAEASPSQSLFEDRGAGVFAWFRSIMLRSRRPSKQDPNTRTQMLVKVPVVEVVSGVNTLVHTLEADVRLKLPDGCSDANRKHLYAFVVNGLGNTLVRGAMRDYDSLN